MISTLNFKKDLKLWTASRSMVTILTVITYLRSLDTYKSSNTDETSIVETTSVVYYKLKLNYYANYKSQNW